MEQHHYDCIAQRMERVMQTFQAARTLAEAHGLSAELSDFLVNSDSYFRSVAYEGTAMGLVLRDSTNNNAAFPQWSALLVNEGAMHAVQVHIGLGWALAEKNGPLQLPASCTDADAVLDGYGYYFGLLRRRPTVRQQLIPSEITSEHLPAFDRGLGRSLWYISKGDMELVMQMMAVFDATRQPNLWRGLSIAVTYVGGCLPAQLDALWQSAGNHQSQLADGAKRVAKSRIKAHTSLVEVEKVCQQWLGIAALEAAKD